MNIFLKYHNGDVYKCLMTPGQGSTFLLVCGLHFSAIHGFNRFVKLLHFHLQLILGGSEINLTNLGHVV